MKHVIEDIFVYSLIVIGFIVGLANLTVFVTEILGLVGSHD